MKGEKIKKELLDRLSGNIGLKLKEYFNYNFYRLNNLMEIRLRTGNPIQLVTADGDFTIPYRPSAEEIQQIVTNLCNSSVYAYEKSIKEGYITIKGGHRIGLAGKYLDEKGIVVVGSINIRVSGEIKGCSNKILPELMRGTSDIFNTVIVSPPGCGKTTLLRDLARNLSYKGFNVGVVDERSEIAAGFMGVPTNDLGPSCDIYDACPKETGIYMMLRAMAPDIIVTDEIGNEKDIEALKKAVTAGVRLIVSCHGKEENDIKNRGLNIMFQKAVILSSANGPGTVERIIRYA